jgi:hypothetical protein
MTNPTNYRALCSELNQWVIELAASHPSLSDSAITWINEVADRARAALAQPEMEGVTDEAPEKDAPVWYNPDMASSWEAGRRDGWSDAIASYGTLAIELAPENVDELVSEKLPDLRQNLETLIRCSRSYDGYSTMTPIELADRIIDAVVSWHPSTLPHQRAALAQPDTVALSPKEVDAREAFTQLRDEILHLSDGLEVNEVLGIINYYTPEWV